MTTQNSAMGDEELEKAIREAIKAPLRSEVSTSDFVVMGISSTKLAEIVFDIKKALLARDQQIALAAQEAELQGELSALNYSNDAFHDLAAPDLEKWFLNQRDRLLEELAEVKQAQNKEK